MRLLYMWIEKSENGVIVNQNLNFSGALFFEYDFCKRNLSIRKKKDYFQDFFKDNESIIDLTAIVGTNGSGKSTVLSEVIRNNTIINNQRRPRIIIAYADILNTKLFLATTAEILNKEELITKYNIEVMEITNIHEIDYSVLYIANSFFGQKEILSSLAYGKVEQYYLSTKSLVNYSRLIFDDKFEWHKERIIFNNYEYFKELYLSTPSELFERFETENQIEYVVKSQNIGRMHWAPEEITLNIRAVNDKDIEILKRKAINRTRANKFINKINNLKSKYSYLIHKTNENGTEDLANKMFYNLLIESQCVLSLSFKGIILDNLVLYIQIFKDFLIKERKKNILKVKNYLGKYEDGENLNLLVNEKIVEDKSEIFDYYIKACEDLLYFSSIYHNRYLDCNESGKDGPNMEFLKLNIIHDKEEIISIFKILKKPYSFLPKYIKIDWRQISEGEYAFLALFSRIFWFLNNINNLKDSLILLIDEVDLYFHPEWQRNLIDYLINDINNLKPGLKIQIIYSTHSPITLSDMPKSNVIFMKKEGTQCKVDDQEMHKQTFASNIYSLFNDSFYLDKSKGVIGEHAYHSLDKAVKIINKEELSEDDEKYIEKLIAIMGDPIIKGKLISMMNNTGK